jgi:hypothetical protein
MSLSQSGTEGGESFGNTDRKFTEQEGGQTVHQREREV